MESARTDELTDGLTEELAEELARDLTGELLTALTVLDAARGNEAERALATLEAQRLPDGAIPAGPPRPGTGSATP